MLAWCLARSLRCEVERLLDSETRSFLGFGPTCEWSTDSLSAFVSYNEAVDGELTASERNITVVEG